MLFIIVLIIALLIAMIYVGFIPRRDILECEAPNGHRFILESKYEWWPYGFLTRNASDKDNQTSFNIYYKNRLSFLPSSTGISTNFSNDNSLLRKICSNVGFFHDHPIVTYRYFESGNWVKMNANSNAELYFSSSPSDLPPSIRTALVQLEAIAEFHYAFIVPVQKYIVFEHPATDGGPVIAVIKSKSFDGGKTWQKPFVTKDAEIFEIGKSLLDQPFIGRPIRFNDKEIRWEELPTRR